MISGSFYILLPKQNLWHKSDCKNKLNELPVTFNIHIFLF